MRRSLGVEFEGFTWPERFLVLSTPFDFERTMPDLVSVNYVADPECWHFLLRIPGMWRVDVPGGAGRQRRGGADRRNIGQSLLSRVVAGVKSSDSRTTTLYRVHQRVAKQFRLGRALPGRRRRAHQ